MKRISILMLIAAVLIACTKDRRNDCKNKMCTYIFVSVMISFTDKDGLPTGVKDFKVINLRTGEEIKSYSNNAIHLAPGVFTVADDNSIANLSEAGDDLQVTGTSIVTNQTKSATLKVTGGKCECHIRKISGPEHIKFD